MGVKRWVYFLSSSFWLMASPPDYYLHVHFNLASFTTACLPWRKGREEGQRITKVNRNFFMQKTEVKATELGIRQTWIQILFYF